LVLEPFEALFPVGRELVEPVALDLAERSSVERVVVLAAPVLCLHETRFAEHPEVLRDGGPADPWEACGDLARGEVLVLAE